MKKIEIGKKFKDNNYKFRETCFGIVFDGKDFFLTSKNGEISLIGGGVEKDESHLDCLKREFIEESGLTIKEIKEFITIDCFWVTRENKEMESLANFYIVNVDKKINEPTEKESKLVKTCMSEITEKIVLPYQKKAIELFLESLA